MGMLKLHKDFILNEKDTARAMFIWLVKECKANISEVSTVSDIRNEVLAYHIEGWDIPTGQERFVIHGMALVPNVLVFEIGKL